MAGSSDVFCSLGIGKNPRTQTQRTGRQFGFQLENLMTKLERTIALLRRGWLTSLESAQRGGCLSLSQRVGELRGETIYIPPGKPGIYGSTVQRFAIRDKWVKTSGGARVKAYRIVKDNKRA